LKDELINIAENFYLNDSNLSNSNDIATDIWNSSIIDIIIEKYNL
jgi:hypothetical protein